MQLAHPHFLWLLVVVPAIVCWRRPIRRPASVPFPSLDLLDGLPKGRTAFIERAGLGLRCLVIALLIVGIARPRWPEDGARIPAESVAIQMVLDVSGSMAEQDFDLNGKKASRLAAARQAFERFLRGTDDSGIGNQESGIRNQGSDISLPGRQDDMVGLVTFAAYSENVCPPTLSHSVVLQMLAEAEPLGTPPESSTNIGDALAEALDVLRRAAPTEKIIVLLSDGEHNVPADVSKGALKPRQTARIAEGLGVRVYTIFVGPRSSMSSAALAQEALGDVAAMTGGKSFAPHDMKALLEVCQDIDQLERTPVQSFEYERYREAYPFLGTAAFCLSLAILLLEGTRWLKVP